VTARGPVIRASSRLSRVSGGNVICRGTSAHGK